MFTHSFIPDLDIDGDRDERSVDARNTSFDFDKDGDCVMRSVEAQCTRENEGNCNNNEQSPSIGIIHPTPMQQQNVQQLEPHNGQINPNIPININAKYAIICGANLPQALCHCSKKN